MAANTLSRLAAFLSLAFAPVDATTIGSLRVPVPKEWTTQLAADTKSAVLLPPALPTGHLCNVQVTAGRDGVTDEAEWHRQLWQATTGAGTALAPVKSGSGKRFRFSEAGFADAAGQRAWFALYTLVANGRGEAILFASDDEALWKKHHAVVEAMVDAVEPVGPAAAAASGPDSILIAPDKPGWLRAEDPQTHVVTFVPPGAGSAANCALYLPPSEPTTETPQAFHDRVVAATTSSGTIAGAAEHPPTLHFLTSVVRVRSKDPRDPRSRVFQISTARFGGRGQAAIFIAADERLFADFSPYVGEIFLHVNVPGHAVAPLHPDVPITVCYLGTGVMVSNSIDAGRRGAPVAPSVRLLACFQNRLCVMIDAQSNSAIDSTHEPGGLAAIDAAALLDDPANRRTGRWSEESDGSVRLAWTTRGAEKFTRTDHGLKGADGSLWSRLESIDGAALDGEFRHVAPFGPPWRIRFTKDGRFEADGVNNVLGGTITNPAFPERGGGRYEVRKWSLILRFDQGFADSIALWTTGEPATTRAITLNGFAFER